MRSGNGLVAIQSFIFASIFSWVIFVPSLHAFSLGPIDVKSGFGERFNAEIIVSLDDGGNAEFHMGTSEDYEKLGLKRPDIIRELEIKPPLEGQEKNKILRVVSSRPLFYPSFNLLIRAEKNDGIILENYFIAVDFQQNVSLAIKGEKEKKTRSEEKVEAKSEEKGVITHEEKAEIKSEEKIAQKQDKEAVKEATKETKESSPAVLVTIPPKPPETVKEDKKPALPVTPSTPVPEEARRTAESPIQGRSYGPVAQGETLSRIVQKLGYGGADLMRVAVAIWMDNRSKFVGSNIHGLKAGELLDLGNLDTVMAQLSLSTANETIRDQLHEWKQRSVGVGRSAPAKMESKDSPDMTEILLMLEDWRQSWENGDLERHMAHYSVSPEPNEASTSYAIWKASKKRLFGNNTHVKIRIERPSTVQEGGQWVVVFDQFFHSDQMDTFGQKRLALKREGPAWKIINEIFMRLKRDAKGREAEASEVTDNVKHEILQALEEWRKSWEAGDFERHMTLFSRQMLISDPDGAKASFEVWRNTKKRMFDRYKNKNVEIHLGEPVFKRNGGRWTLSFEQTFRSGRTKTFGRKNLEFVKEETGWKIVKEEFVSLNQPTGEG